MKNISQVTQKTFGSLPEKIIQFGEGNFLRAFADYITDTANAAGKFNGSIVLCQPIERGMCDAINAQNGIYTLLMRGVENGEVVEKYKTLTSVSRCVNPYADYEQYIAVARNEELKVVISNTTEAGIAYREGDLLTDTPPVSYPAKLAAFLYERYKTFNGAADKGLLILPVELIENNGTFLKKYILQYVADWGISEGFSEWINTSCHIANTLVDRIVTGYPHADAQQICEKLGYEDNLLDTCEPFLFWAIEADEKWAEVFPITDLGLDVVFVPDITAYKTRKVRILNGSHTLSVLAAYLAGHDIVLEMMNDEVFSSLIKNALREEIIPFIPLPEQEKADFAASVLERFGNPFIKHRLLDISLNSVSKYKARCLPSVIDYTAENHRAPKALAFGLAALIRFYKGEFEDGKYFGTRNGEKYEIRDDEAVLKFMCDAWKTPQTVKAVLSNTVFWGRNLTQLEGFTEAVENDLASIERFGVRAALERL
ncbi:MAG: tagaturonate reductase [Clostridiales bacterium]|nr:tagaturonate reductase [Clostridiales bacterium]